MPLCTLAKLTSICRDINVALESYLIIYYNVIINYTLLLSQSVPYTFKPKGVTETF